MQGFFVSTKADVDDAALKTLETLGFVNLRTVRTFNKVTGGVYKNQTRTVRGRIHRNDPEVKAKREEYNKREEVKRARKAYESKPETKMRKREYSKRRTIALNMIPPEIWTEVYKKMAELEKKDEVLEENKSDE